MMSNTGHVMTAIYTSPTFPKGWVLIEERYGEHAKYTWETPKVERFDCSAKFVQARKHAWTRREV